MAGRRAMIELSEAIIAMPLFAGDMAQVVSISAHVEDTSVNGFESVGVGYVTGYDTPNSPLTNSQAAAIQLTSLTDNKVLEYNSDYGPGLPIDIQSPKPNILFAAYDIEMERGGEFTMTHSNRLASLPLVRVIGGTMYRLIVESYSRTTMQIEY